MGQCGVKYSTFVTIISKMSFVGNHTVKSDAKNRIAIPANFRKTLAESGDKSFVLQKDIFQNCLTLYPISEWEKQLSHLREKLNPYNSKHKRFKSQFFRDTAELSLDSGGRILLPQKLMQLAGIEKEIEIIGTDTTIEIWNKIEYDNYGMKTDEFATLTEDILGNENEITI